MQTPGSPASPASPADDTAKFGAWLKDRRQAFGYTQKELALHAGCSVETIRKIEAGMRKPSRQVVELLARCFQVPQEEQTALLHAALSGRSPHSLVGLGLPPALQVSGPVAHPAGPAVPSIPNHPAVAACWMERPGGTTHTAQGVTQPPTKLPAPLTSFVGREQELADIRRLLPASRLLTLTGPGGCGKTRLALRLAEDLLATAEYPNGLWWTDLADLADPSLVPQAVALSLGVREQPGRQLLETLADYAGPKRVLLILDNCEHLLAACAKVASALLRACPHLQVLATSREALHIPGEYTWPVPSLSLPPPYSFPAATELTLYDAVHLFVERARASLPDFAVTAQNAFAVAQICYRLDGIPLAIELAAARVRVLSAGQIAERLDSALSLLTRGSLLAVPRQQTLRATLDWSYDLLAPNEQALFRQLSVFAGTFALEAVEAVCAGAGIEPGEPGTEAGIEMAEILDLLSELVDKSLVAVERQEAGATLSGGTRYRLLDTIRQYGRERLAAAGETTLFQARHASWYLELAEQADLEHAGTQQVMWLDRLEAEHDNFRTALEWAMRAQQAEIGLRIGAALCEFWNVRDYRTEGRVWLNQVLSLSDGHEYPKLRARVLLGAGTLARQGADFEAARALLTESLAISRDLGDTTGFAAALGALGAVAVFQQDYATARSLIEESLSINRAAGDRHSLAVNLNRLGRVLYHQGDYALARSLLEECLALDRELSKLDKGRTIGNLGLVCQAQGDFVQAHSCFRQYLAMSREVGSERESANALLWLARLAEKQGDPLAEQSYLRESLAVFWELRARDGTASCLAHLARRIAAGAQADGMAAAARLFAAIDTLLAEPPSLLLPVDPAEHERALGAVRAAMDKDAFAAAWAEGRAMMPEQVVEYALALLAPRGQALPAETTPPTHPPSPRQAARQQFGGLTAREREVAVLVAQGNSNAEIATALVTSKRTVEKHIGSILAKLGFTSRAQIVAWALERGLGKQT